MNKQETTIVILLVVALIAWFVFDRPSPQQQPAPVPPEEEVREPAPESASNMVTRVPEPEPAPPESVTAPEPVEAPAPVEPPDPVRPPVAPPEIVRPSEPERIVQLTNAFMNVSVSSWGGGIVRVEYAEYRESLAADSGPLVLDFRSRPALSLARLPGLSTNADFTVEAGADGVSAVIQRETPAGLRYRRRVALQENYRIAVTDTMTNVQGQPLAVPGHAVRLGFMSPVATKATTRGIAYLGIDTLSERAGEGVTYWNKGGMFRASRLQKLFKSEMEGVTDSIIGDVPAGTGVSWVCVKNKFFAQILVPIEEGGAQDFELYARRGDEKKQIDRVGASLVQAEATLQPGESATRTFSYYVGPKKYAFLKELGRYQEKVMEFGRWFGWMCGPLLWILNGFYGIIPNYGIAIILLTGLVRLVFWPVMHKSTTSMKRMQEIQPLVAEIKKKHEGNAQKIQQETMALYKEHKVNPMASCLPMLIQIPVFIALFTVLRSAVELRFADFLWIQDLSEPEAIPLGALLFMEGPFSGLFAFKVNFLPLYMTGTMILQQRLTPSASDQQQKTMMMIMPIVMLVMFYNMASALVLYWSTSQTFAILQMALQQWKGKKAKASSKSPATR